MQSTQRNESMNAKIKQHITSSLRTKFIYLVKILTMISDEELRKVKSFQKKVIKISYQQNATLEFELAKIYCTAISKRIYLEFSRSFIYASPTTRQGTTVYMLESYVDNKIYTIDVSTDRCSCMKSTYLGIPCCHILATWRYLNIDFYHVLKMQLINF